MSVSEFERASTPSPEGQITFDPEWMQGRGIYGGVPAAAMVHQMTRLLDRRECVLRSLTVHFCSPLNPVDSVVTAEAVRIGKSVAHMRSEVQQAGEVVAYGSASFGAPRAVEIQWQEPVMPSLRPAASLPPVSIPHVGGPRFAQFFDYRFGGERLPMTGGDTAKLRTWIRPSDRAVVDTPLAVGMLDAMVPAILCRLTAPRMMASVDFRIQLFTPFPMVDVDPNDHWLLDAHARVVDDGYSEQITWLYTPTGQLVGSCQQLIAILS